RKTRVGSESRLWPDVGLGSNVLVSTNGSFKVGYACGIYDPWYFTIYGCVNDFAIQFPGRLSCRNRAIIDYLDQYRLFFVRPPWALSIVMTATFMTCKTLEKIIKEKAGEVIEKESSF